MTEVLARQPRPQGPRLTIITNAGGPGVLATDAVVRLGAELATLAPETMQALNRVLPPHWSHANPVDVIGDAGPERYAESVKAIAADPNTDGLLVIMTPQAMSDPVAIAKTLTPFAAIRNKPVLASWMGGEKAAEGEAVLNAAGIPTFPFPDAAVRAFHYMWRYSYNLRALYETPAVTSDSSEAAPRAAELIERVRQSGRTLLTEFESKQMLTLYGIPTVDTRIAATEEDALRAARELGYPVALKLNSFTITHKTDVHGVKLHVSDDAAVRASYREIQAAVTNSAGPDHFQGVTVQRMITSGGYELILGSSVDPQFGPVLLFGAGGQLVEVFHDRALALPPLNTTLARRFIEQTRIYKALQGVRGQPAVDLEELDCLLVRFSQLVLEQPWIREIDINPLLASGKAILALDARVLLYSAETTSAEVPKPAIRPYPSQYAKQVMLRDGTAIHIRPIRPEDEPSLIRFHSTLSDESVYKRYFSPMNLESRIDHERLVRMCFIDYDRQMALIAEAANASGGPREIVGVGRLIKMLETNEAELAFLVSDAFQGRGIGSELIQGLIAFGRDEKLARLTAVFLAGNRAMEQLFRDHGFTFADGPEPELRETELRL
ncbi:MAG: GNAT family N-acetyltransferase [Acidobacteriaceae bacterium]|nr:GNAT family N-acetyltransferase [Acidobacteriaceae bacterium]